MSKQSSGKVGALGGLIGVSLGVSGDDIVAFLGLDVDYGRYRSLGGLAVRSTGSLVLAWVLLRAMRLTRR